MSFGTKWAIRAAVFGLVLHLLLTSAIICIIILIGKNIGTVKSITMIIPFSVHALEFLAAVSLLRTKRMNNPFMEKCSTWLTTTKYLSPCIVIEEGILISWDFHLFIVLAVGVSYALAMRLVVNCLQLKCDETRRRSLQTMYRRSAYEARRLNNSETFQSGINARWLQSCRLSTRPAQLTLVEFHPHDQERTGTGIDRESLERLVETEDMEDDLPLPMYDDTDEDEDNDDSHLPSYDDALRLLLLSHMNVQEFAHDDDLPPCYEDVFTSTSN